MLVPDKVEELSTLRTLAVWKPSVLECSSITAHNRALEVILGYNVSKVLLNELIRIRHIRHNAIVSTKRNSHVELIPECGSYERDMRTDVRCNTRGTSMRDMEGVGRGRMMVEGVDRGRRLTK